MRTSEVLNRAADLIEERGWVQGSGGWPGHMENKGTLCLEGGIMAALGRDWGRGDSNRCPAYDAVCQYLGIPRAFAWNDARGRTAAEVIETLRACALIEQAREDQDAAELTYAENMAAVS